MDTASRNYGPVAFTYVVSSIKGYVVGNIYMEINVNKIIELFFLQAVRYTSRFIQRADETLKFGIIIFI